MSATFSPCRRYRYMLARGHDPFVDGRQTALFIMLNPSTADETCDDPTVTRCLRRAMRLGYTRLTVCNIFALRSTDPKVLYRESDPIGPGNDETLIAHASHAGIVICGWGEDGALGMRGLHVRRMLAKRSIPMHALKINVSGEPQHPLYIGYAVQPIPLPESKGRQA